MKITAGDETLVDQAAERSWLLEKLDITSISTLEQVLKYKAQFIEVEDRGNISNRLIIQVSKLHASVDEAVDWFLLHPQRVARVSTIQIRTTTPEGGERNYFIEKAGIEQITGGFIVGRTSYNTYSVICGEIKTEVPDAS